MPRGTRRRDEARVQSLETSDAEDFPAALLVGLPRLCQHMPGYATWRRLLSCDMALKGASDDTFLAFMSAVLGAIKAEGGDLMKLRPGQMTPALVRKQQARAPRGTGVKE